METVATAPIASLTQKTQIYAQELLDTLNDYQQKISILSLDCFDTILWRKTASPQDMFFDLQQHSAFQDVDFTARLRISAESKARQIKLVQHGFSEVNLQDIYLTGIPTLTHDQVEALMEAELACEMATCYSFPPVVELMRAAHAKGLKIIIVSDTYLSESQLRRLLSSILPDDVMNTIFKIFCSNEHRKSKSQGLFKTVLDKLYTKPRSVLHIGDNLFADLIAPKNLGVGARQLLHVENSLGEQLRMEALSSSFFDSSIRQTRSLTSPFRGIFAATNYALTRPESAIGYSVLGPIMFAFAKFITDEAKQLTAAGKRVKILFLLRDGHLPAQACTALNGKPIGYPVSISRFAAYAATFRRKEDIQRYLAETVASLRFDAICQQLLLPEKLAKSITEKALAVKNSALEFSRLINTEEVIATIIQKSAAYRARLKRYLEKEVGLEAGDTLMFVDLGYTGTAQRQLTPVFKDEMDVDIVGRYLLALHVPNWKASRSGLLDPSWCDNRTLNTLVTYIALLEQMCTSNEGSVLDYDDAGNTILAAAKINQQQQEKLISIQAECLQFIHHAKTFYQHNKANLEIRILRDAVLGSLARLLFIPTESELHYLQAFQFDLNLGTQDLLEVFDQNKGLEGLRRRGIFFMEKNLKTMRTNYPAELRSAGLELVLLLMAQLRFDLDIRPADLSFRREALQVIVIRNMGQTSQISLTATPTHDGYFSVLIPVGTGNIQIGILFGLGYQWIQLESAELIKAALLMGSQESENTTDASSNLAIDSMIDQGGGLFECQTEAAMLIYASDEETSDSNQALRIVFRPIVKRQAALA